MSDDDTDYYQWKDNYNKGLYEDDTEDLHEDTDMDLLVCPCCMQYSLSQEDIDEQVPGYLCTRCNEYVWMGH